MTVPVTVMIEKHGIIIIQKEFRTDGLINEKNTPMNGLSP